MAFIIRQFAMGIVVLQMMVSPSWAKPQGHSFSKVYVQLYNQAKTTHQLAKMAEKYKSQNHNLPFLIEQIKSQPDQNIPSVKWSGGHLYFSVSGRAIKVTAVDAHRFLIDGQMMDLRTDLSKQWPKTSYLQEILMAKAWAVVPLLFWAAVILVGAVVGASVCFNSSVDNYFGQNELKAKWLKPGSFNKYLRKLKEELKPLCPGAAWADSAPTEYDYNDFFHRYCSGLKRGEAKSAAQVIAAGFNESLANSLYGSADDGDKALMQAAAMDEEFMQVCLENSNPISNSIPPQKSGVEQ